MSETPFAMPPLLPQPRRFAALGADYAPKVPTAPLPEPRLLHFNAALAAEIGLDAAAAQSTAFAEALAGNRVWPGYDTVSSVYAGHQFGTFVPQLGDGRAHLLAAANAGSCSSRAAARRRGRASPTAAPCCVPRSANTSPPRRCTPSASPPPAR